jgi:hypothetical protein
VESVSRWREPAAFVTLAALAVNIGLAAVALLMGVRLVEAAPRVSGAGAHALLLVIAAALAASCVLVERTPHAGLIAVLGAVLAIITLGWAMAYALVTWLRVGYATVAEVLALLVGLVPPALALSLLIVLLRPAPTRTPATGSEPGPAVAMPEPPDPQREPTWAPDVATGAAWRTAGEAAAGVPAQPPVNPLPEAPATPDRHPWWGPPPGPAGPPRDQWADQEQRFGEEPRSADRPW